MGLKNEWRERSLHKTIIKKLTRILTQRISLTTGMQPPKQVQLPAENVKTYFDASYSSDCSHPQIY